ncbi:MAG: NusG domain II-containing protein [Ruminococcus sp.]|nr:NusG domain II-containing protein [Ruminococcus sp.]
MTAKKAAVTALCTALAAAAACIMMLYRPHGDIVLIKQDGRVIYTLDLSKEKDREIVVEYKGRKNVIAIENGEIYMKEADCPDHVCIHTGRLSGGAPIICLPNRLVIEYADRSTDAAAG